MALGKTLMIANPTAQNGKGLQAAIHVAEALKTVLGEKNFDVEYTMAPRHAIEIVEKRAAHYQHLIALGGDGIIHECANGLMRLEKKRRPVYAIIPVGSGNDYAKSLGMSTKVDKAVQQVLLDKRRPADVGCVNGEHFVETLSFGLDAAIALGTVERRQETTKTGTALYFDVGIDQLLHHLDVHDFRATLSGVEQLGKHELCFEEGVERSSQAIIFAVQIGVSYGGGFEICPEAKFDDGLFDICFAHPYLSPLRAVGIFASAVHGHHTRFKRMEFARCNGMQLHFEAIPPCQADGERVTATDFEITMDKHALTVIAA